MKIDEGKAAARRQRRRLAWIAAPLLLLGLLVGLAAAADGMGRIGSNWPSPERIAASVVVWSLVGLAVYGLIRYRRARKQRKLA